MALTMLDKKAVAEDRGEWPAELKAEFERESRQNNGCVADEGFHGRSLSLRFGVRVGFYADGGLCTILGGVIYTC